MAMASSDSSSGGSGDRDVFGSLPNSRPQRRSARRDRSTAKAKPAATGPAEAAAKAKPAPAGPAEAAAKAKPAATGPAEAAAKPKAAGRAKAATSANPKPAARAEPAARAAAATPATPAARAARAAQAKSAAKETPPRAGAAQIPPAGYATPRPDDDGVPRGAELVTTAVQAAGELAQIGLAAGGRALKSALERLPRP
jgi:hypothetical protein